MGSSLSSSSFWLFLRFLARLCRQTIKCDSYTHQNENIEMTFSEGYDSKLKTDGPGRVSDGAARSSPGLKVDFYEKVHRSVPEWQDMLVCYPTNKGSQLFFAEKWHKFLTCIIIFEISNLRFDHDRWRVASIWGCRVSLYPKSLLRFSKLRTQAGRAGHAHPGKSWARSAAIEWLELLWPSQQVRLVSVEAERPNHPSRLGVASQGGVVSQPGGVGLHNNNSDMTP